MVAGHHLLLHRSPHIVTNYINVEIKQLDLGVSTEITLHTRHALIPTQVTTYSD